MGLNLCWIQIRGTLSVWLETKAWNPYCINLRDQSPLSARASPGSVQPGINPCAQAVSYGYWIQRWSCDMARTLLCCSLCLSLSLSLWHLMESPAGPQCNRQAGQAPVPQITSLPAYSKVGSLAYRPSETPEGSWQRTKVKDIPLPHCHLYRVCLFVNYISNGGHNKTW